MFDELGFPLYMPMMQQNSQLSNEKPQGNNFDFSPILMQQSNFVGDNNSPTYMIQAKDPN